jgi:hypothetical protein
VALRRFVAVAASREQDRKWVAFIPRKRFGNEVAGCELLLGRGYAIYKRKTPGLTVPPSQFARADEVIE